MLFLACLLPAAADADTPPYHLNASVMGASGALSTVTGFRLTGTLGQAQVIGPMTGTTLRHVAGFWAVLAGPRGVSGVVPSAFVDALHQNSPNPFNPATTITFSLARENNVRLVVHDVRGWTVATLVRDWLPAGPHAVVWRGIDDVGRRVPSGLYFYSLDVGDFHSVRKMILVK
jgi:hypothetical protein